MEQTQLFSLLLVSLVMGISGARELRNEHFAMGALLLGVPLCGWLSIAFGVKP